MPWILFAVCSPGCPAGKFEVIRLGLDLEGRAIAAPGEGCVERGRLGVPQDQLLVGWFGRMTEIKRVDDLLRSFADRLFLFRHRLARFFADRLVPVQTGQVALAAWLASRISVAAITAAQTPTTRTGQQHGQQKKLPHDRFPKKRRPKHHGVPR